jgi:hypothetical protein
MYNHVSVLNPTKPKLTFVELSREEQSNRLINMVVHDKQAVCYNAILHGRAGRAGLLPINASLDLLQILH